VIISGARTGERERERKKERARPHSNRRYLRPICPSIPVNFVDVHLPGADAAFENQISDFQARAKARKRASSRLISFVRSFVRFVRSSRSAMNHAALVSLGTFKFQITSGVPVRPQTSRFQITSARAHTHTHTHTHATCTGPNIVRGEERPVEGVAPIFTATLNPPTYNIVI